MEPHELAALLEREHRERIAYHSLIDEFSPLSLARAYEVQDAFVERLRGLAGENRGYKVGLTSRRMQQLCGLDAPVAGRVLEGRVLQSPATITLDRFVHLGVESELCLLLAHDLPARETPYSIEEALRAVGGVAAAFELIDDRGADYQRLEPFTLVADNSWNEGVVLGRVHATNTVELSGLAGTLIINDRIVDRGNSADTLEHPCAVVAWLATELGRRGAALRAGDLIMTGSVVPTRFATRGERYRFELAGLSPVELQVV